MTVRVVYVAGAARSGSTILERLLARGTGCWPVGELVFVWQRGLLRGDMCGCGARFGECAFWQGVGEHAFGGWSNIDGRRAAELRSLVDRHRHLPRLVRLAGRGSPAPSGGGLAAAGSAADVEPSDGARLEASIENYRWLTGRLYRSVAAMSGTTVSGTTTIVDSSKHIGHMLVLASLPDVDLRVVHMVRRSHGVAHSWSRHVLKPDVGDGTVAMSTHSALWSSGLWMADNAILDQLGGRLQHFTRCRYEDLVRDPEAELARIRSALSLPAAEQDTDLAATIAMPEEHSISGNPVRLAGTISLREDDEWRRAMPPGRRAAVTAMTWPLLLRYGYLSDRGGRGGRGYLSGRGGRGLPGERQAATASAGEP